MNIEASSHVDPRACGVLFYDFQVGSHMTLTKRSLLGCHDINGGHLVWTNLASMPKFAFSQKILPQK